MENDPFAVPGAVILAELAHLGATHLDTDIHKEVAARNKTTLTRVSSIATKNSATLVHIKRLNAIVASLEQDKQVLKGLVDHLSKRIALEDRLADRWATGPCDLPSEDEWKSADAASIAKMRDNGTWKEEPMTEAA